METSKPSKGQSTVSEMKLETTLSARQQRALDLTADQPAARLRVRSLADLALPGEALTDNELGASVL